MRRALYCLIALLLSGWSGGAVADVVNYSCGIGSCVYEHKIGESMTREFRGECRNAQPEEQRCEAKNQNVTCTVTVCDSGFCSCSCTNWSPTGRHPAAIVIYCN
jgi:hypothetical protein